MNIRSVMPHAWRHKLQWFRLKWPFCLFLFCASVKFFLRNRRTSGLRGNEGAQCIVVNGLSPDGLGTALGVVRVLKRESMQSDAGLPRGVFCTGVSFTPSYTISQYFSLSI